MKKSVAFAVTLLMSSLLFQATGEAYFLDSPHNGSNGIECNYCHTTYFQSGGDNSIVCLQCHGTATDILPLIPY
ncbi:MAG: hypothetical protein KKA70_16065, partial [Proteobacteria bacterium]|nr:hypothetical protein [Pseudomonadota bacterium]